MTDRLDKAHCVHGVSWQRPCSPCQRITNHLTYLDEVRDVNPHRGWQEDDFQTSDGGQDMTDHRHKWLRGGRPGCPIYDYCRSCGAQKPDDNDGSPQAKVSGDESRKNLPYRAITPPTKSEAITLDLDGQSIEVATGFKGVGVFMTIIGARGNRIITVALPRSKASELSKLLRLANDASRFNQAKDDAP